MQVTYGQHEAAIGDTGDPTVEAFAQLDPTSLNPYGQLLKMLVPRALNISIHDDKGHLLWSADGCESSDVQQLTEDELAYHHQQPSTGREWCIARRHTLGMDTAFVFSLNDAQSRLMGMVVLTHGGREASRTLESMLGLLRPALEILLRELVNKNSIENLQRDLQLRDGDIKLLLSDEGDMPDNLHEVDDFGRLIRICIKHMNCGLGALLVPDKNIAVYRVAERVSPAAASELLNKTHRHLFAASQVQRRSMMLNRVVENGPFASLGHKVLTCPVVAAGQRVVGVLALFRPLEEADFVLREVHLVELLSRRVSHILQQSYDAGTGLLTRQTLDRRVNQVLRTPQSSPDHQVIYIDIDRLHVINETMGMHVGDEIIQRVAALIRGVTTHKVMAARISGDRYAVFMQTANLDAATHLAKSLCTGVDQLGYRFNDKLVEVTASFGVAPVVMCEHPLSRALASAEAACKAAKDRGRGRVEIFADEDQSIIRRFEDANMLGAIRDAIDQDRFRMMAQLIEPLQIPGDYPRYELLLRMVGTDGQLLTPDKFLNAAERYQLAPTIDRWVVNYVLEMVSAIGPHLAGRKIRFAVNLSGQSLGEDDFVTFLETRLAAYPDIAKLIGFEITETAAVSNIVRAERLIRRLKELGHVVALDDFGKGLSSLSYLKNLPVDVVKLDGELIRDLVSNDRSRAMVTAVVQLAKALNLRTTAECIESGALRQIVKELGVDFAQGFGVGTPRPFEELLQELVTTSSASSNTTRQRVIKART